MSNAKPALISLTDLNGEPFPIGGISLVPPRYKGNKFWRYRIYHPGLAGGRTEENTHKATKAEAESLARQAYAVIADGCEEIPEGGSDTPQAMNFGEAARLYLNSKGEDISAQLRYTLARVIDEIGYMPLGKIDYQVLDRLWGAMSIKPTTNANGRMKAESANTAIWTPVFAVLNFHNVEYNIPRPKRSKPKNRAIDHGTREAVLDYFAQHEPDMWRFLQIGFNTGMRFGEILALDWKDIDQEREGFISIYMSKTDETRYLPIVQALRDVLNQWPEDARHGRLFPRWNNQKALQYYLKKLHRDTGIKMTMHQTRHTFATNLVNSNVSSVVIQAAGGWNDPRSMKRYVKPDSDALARALNKLPA